jgi:High potential iron-sulfur protein
MMTNQPERPSAKLSRRSVLLYGAAGVTGVATILVANANSAKANPLPKTAVNYQDTPKGDRRCSNCSLFVPPNACKSVAGVINPNGWCMLWRKA